MEHSAANNTETMKSVPDPLEVIAKKLPSKVQKVVHVWEKEAADDLLKGIVLAASEGKVDADRSEQRPHKDLHGSTIGDEDLPEIRACDRMFCGSCGQQFDAREDQIEHFKSDWHRFNLKRKLKGDPVVSEQKFEEMTHAGDLSSISGSDSETDDGTDEATDEVNTKDEDEDFDTAHIEGVGRRHPRVFLRNAEGKLMSIYRCVIHGKKNQASSSDDLLSMVKRLPAETTWSVIMMGGGHFAGAVFQGNEVIDHKTFHRYIVRAKRGTVQSSRDNKGHAPKSGGATIRRYNEAALSQEIQDLMTSWTEHIKNCSRIFLRVPTYSKASLFGGKTPVFDKKDSRIRLIPFETRRATFKEVKRVHDVLSSIECYGEDSRLEDHVTSSPKKPGIHVKSHTAGGKSKAKFDCVQKDLGENGHSKEKASDSESDEGDIVLMTESLTLDTSHLQPFESTKKPRRRKKKKEKQEEPNRKPESNDAVNVFSNDPEIISLRNDLYTACKTKNTENLRTLIEKVKSMHHEDRNNAELPTTEEGDTKPSVEGNADEANPQNRDSPSGFAAELLCSTFGDKVVTLLHVASQAGHTDAVSLLMEAGADPTLRDAQGQFPYLAASLKETRNEFRRFREKYPDMYDYTKAQIPEPLSEEREKEKKAREAARKKAAKLSKKERLKDQLAEEAARKQEEREQQRFLALSDREKRALAAERRFTSQVATQGGSAPVLSRCFQCGKDVTGQVPFEYDVYKFCTTKCLKEHRLKNTSKKS